MRVVRTEYFPPQMLQMLLAVFASKEFELYITYLT